VSPGGKEWPGRHADPSPASNAMVMKEYSYTSTLTMGRTACAEPQCLYKRALFISQVVCRNDVQCSRIVCMPYVKSILIRFIASPRVVTEKVGSVCFKLYKTVMLQDTLDIYFLQNVHQGTSATGKIRLFNSFKTFWIRTV
jgi:hypothetical protein